MTTQKIDLEPTWEDLCRAVASGALKDAMILKPACKIADIIRQAQKQGKKEVTFSFQGDRGEMSYEVID